jgi:hypothetical protein
MVLNRRPPLGGREGLDHIGAQRSNTRQRIDVVRTHLGGVAGDIGRQDAGETAIDFVHA